MKQLFFFPLSVFVATTLPAQKQNAINKLYGELGFGTSTKNGGVGTAGLRTVLSSNWTIGLSYHALSMDPPNLPADYHPGFVLFIPTDYPDVELELLSLTAGRYLPVSRRVWFNIGAGISVASGKEFQFTPEQSTVIFPLALSSNYSYVEKKNTTIGGMVEADVNWAFLKFAGLSAGGFANVNGIQSPVGWTLKLLIGRMNIKKQ